MNTDQKLMNTDQALMDHWYLQINSIDVEIRPTPWQHRHVISGFDFHPAFPVPGASHRNFVFPKFV